MGEREVAAFLTWLAEERRVALSTQVQAQAALVFLYREVLERPLRMPNLVPRGRGPTRVPVVLDVDEVGRVLGQLEGVHRLVGLLLYGSGLRLMECLELLDTADSLVYRVTREEWHARGPAGPGVTNPQRDARADRQGPLRPLSVAPDPRGCRTPGARGSAPLPHLPVHLPPDPRYDLRDPVHSAAMALTGA